MTRINVISADQNNGKAKELLDAVQAKLGITPNMMKTMAQSPAVLEAYLNFGGALDKTLNAKLREQIALVSAEENGCGYCASAHTAIGKMVGLGEDAIYLRVKANAEDAKIDAALKFAKQVVEKRGKVNDEDVAKVKNAGFGDGQIAEIVANVALNVFTNYFNEVAQTEIDFPKVELFAKANAA